MVAKLYVVPASHPCATVMKALELKGIAYERVDLVPTLHRVLQKARFGGRGTVPGIVLEDGRKLSGSRAIVREVDRLRPQPPLFPAADDRRRRVEEAEEWGDQALQPLVRRVLWHALAAQPSAQLSYLEGARLVPPLPRVVARVGGTPVAFLARRLNASTQSAVRADLTGLHDYLDRIDAWLQEGVLGGDAPNAADLQIAASVRLLLTLEDLEPLIAPRPAAALAARWFATYPGRTPAGALPAAWLPRPAATAA